MKRFREKVTKISKKKNKNKTVKKSVVVQEVKEHGPDP